MTDEHRSIVAAVTDALHREGVMLEVDGTHARVTFDGTTHWRRLRITAEDGVRHWPEPTDGLLLLARRFTPGAAAEIDSRGGWLADARGTIRMRAPGLRIAVDGRVAVHRPADVRSDGARATSLFTPARAQVVMALLAWPDLVSGSAREVANAAGVSPGMAHKAMVLLERRGYRITGSPRLHRGTELLQDWARAFALGLGPALTLGRFTADPYGPPPAGVVVSGAGAMVDGPQGAGQVVYAHGLDPSLVLRSRWRPPREGEPANVVVRRQFWNEPPDGRHPLERWLTPGSAPWPLVYADLASGADPRENEAAHLLLKCARAARAL